MHRIDRESYRLLALIELIALHRERGSVAVSAMTPTQSKRLKIGQRVAWRDSADDQGTVIGLVCGSNGTTARTNSSTTTTWEKSK